MDRTVELAQVPSYDARHIARVWPFLLVELWRMTIVIGQRDRVGECWSGDAIRSCR